MEQAFGKFLMFENRLQKVYKRLSKIARKQNVSCYRIYDHDLPEFPFIIEAYETSLYVSEYKRRHGMEDDEHDDWLEKCKEIMSDTLNVDLNNIFIKVRQKKEGRRGQYQKTGGSRAEFVVNENGLKLLVNLSDYLDTGLFLDHRITRQMVKELSAQKKVLNLFSYTGSFSVYAAAGGAIEITSVDLSKTYLDWSQKNMRLNFPLFQNHKIVHADVLKYLKEFLPGSFDLIVLDPPTFSNSKRMDDFLDIQKDHVQLINDCLEILKKDGCLFFSTNYTKFQMKTAELNSSAIKDITKQTTPFDFTGKLQRQCFILTK